MTDSSINRGPARTLDEAFSNLNPRFSLKQDSPDWKWFYVERSNDTLKTLRRALRSVGSDPCLLYSGHTGCGKSTELERAAHDEQLNREHLVIHYSVKDELDPVNIDFADILISIGAKLFLAADQAGLKLKNLHLDAIREWKDTIIEKNDVVMGAMEIKVQADVRKLFLGFLGILKGSHEQKETYTTKIKPKINTLIELINKYLCLEIDATLGKKPLVIIDDLEKVSLEQAKSIFHDHGHLLASLRCHVIYTFPIALEYDLAMNSITGLFGDVIRLPNIKIQNRQGADVPENIELMKEIVLRRMRADLIEPEALLRAIRYSGGVVRELFRILYRACDKALNMDMPKLTEEHIQSAITKVRNDYVFSLREKHYEYLARVERTKEVEGDQAYVELMHSMHILKYVNDDDWFQVHPMIRERVQQRARQIIVDGIT
jgi:hypothetical protein